MLTQDECQLLGYLDKGKRKRKEKAGSLQWAYMAIARLGGFMDSKRTGIASWGALWEGWEALQSKLDVFFAAKDLMAQGIKISIKRQEPCMHCSRIQSRLVAQQAEGLGQNSDVTLRHCEGIGRRVVAGGRALRGVGAGGFAGTSWMQPAWSASRLARPQCL